MLNKAKKFAIGIMGAVITGVIVELVVPQVVDWIEKSGSHSRSDPPIETAQPDSTPSESVETIPPIQTPTPTPLPTEQPVNERVSKVNILEMQPFVGDLDDFVYNAGANGDNVDNVGNTYPSGYELCYNGYGWNDRLINKVTFILDKQYTTLSGTIALRQSYNDIEDGVWLEFYEGDILLYETDHLYAGIRPVEFSYDVSDVDELTMMIMGGDDIAFILTDGIYLE